MRKSWVDRQTKRVSEKSDANRLMCILTYTFYPSKMIANIASWCHAPWNDHCVYVRSFMLIFLTASLLLHRSVLFSVVFLLVFFSFYPFIMHLFICYSRFVRMLAIVLTPYFVGSSQLARMRRTHIEQINKKCLRE